MNKLKVFWTVLFAFVSAGLTWQATGSLSAGGAVLFGLWSVAGLAELNQ